MERTSLLRCVLFGGMFSSTFAWATPGGVLLELFTSQSCYSCPPADRLLHKLDTGDENLIALEFHVDYWDELVWGSDGQWKDPFSSPDYTARQRRYNATGLQGQSGVYTPQLVIEGQIAAVGSQARHINKAINGADVADFNFHWSEDGNQLSLSLEGKMSGDATVWIAEFIRATQTHVTHGENARKRLDNHHVVTKVRILPRSGLYSFARPDGANRGCAVVVQEANQGRVLAASYCP